MNKWAIYYPRPRLKRDSFISLDGKWILNNHEIEVPFAPQSRLSNYHGPLSNNLHYLKEFALPKGFNSISSRLILHFSAIDQIADIFLNDQLLLHHEGGYLPFEIDISEYVLKNNILKVEVIDKLDHFYPYGKQTKNPSGMWYTPVSGIWQSVWLEKVPRYYIKDIAVKTNKDKLIIDIDSNDFAFFIDIPINKKQHYKQYFETKHIEIAIKDITDNPHYWSCEDPFLYSLIITTKNDKVESYFGIKDIEIKYINDIPYVYLNGNPLLIKGILDQGYFEDGIYLPEDPQEYFNDVLKMKELGFNLLRKHIKVEPDIFYYACDKLGMLVMQDFVNSGSFNVIYNAFIPTFIWDKKPDYIFVNKKRLEFFIEHSKGIVKKVDSHPSVIAYTIYNEGWGQKKADYVYDIFKPLVADKLLDSTSGWWHQKKSDFESYHIYFRNKVVKSKKKQLLMISECGGYKRAIEGHLFNPNEEYGYGKVDSEENLNKKYSLMYEKMIIPSINKGLSGFIITQLSDVETEINGLYTYDRRIAKINKKEMLILNQKAENIFLERIKNIEKE